MGNNEGNKIAKGGGGEGVLNLLYSSKNGGKKWWGRLVKSLREQLCFGKGRSTCQLWNLIGRWNKWG